MTASKPTNDKITRPHLSLGEWVKKTFYSSKKSNTSAVTAETLSHFGLRSEVDVLEFLRSPVGKIEEAEFNAAKAHNASLLVERFHQLLLHYFLMHALRALLFLWYLEGKSQEKAIQNLETLQQQEKILHQGTANKVATPSPQSKPEFNKALEETLKFYEAAISKLKEQLDSNAQAETAVEDLLHDTLEQKNQLHVKYDLYHDYLLERVNFIHAKAQLTETTFEEVLEAIQANIQKKSLTVTDPLVQPSLRMHELLAHALEMQMIHQMLAVFRKEHYFANHMGQPVGSITEAHFVLEKGQQLIEDNNLLYLLKPGQDWESVKNNPHEKQQAKENFENNKPALLSKPKLIQHKRQAESVALENRIEMYTTQRTVIQQQRLQITQELAHIQQVRTDFILNVAFIQNVPTLTPKPQDDMVLRPTPTPTPAFQNKLEVLQNQPRITPHMMFQLAALAAVPERQEMQAYLNKNLAKMQKDIPLSAQARRELLKYMEKFGAFGQNPVLHLDDLAHGKLKSHDTAPNPFQTNLRKH